MSAAATVFAGGVLAAAIGRQRSRQAMRFQTATIFVVGMLLAGGTAHLFVSGAGRRVWTAAALIGLSLAAASALVTASRPNRD
jgi:hypothetical protein